jgi:hypothetical protein
MTTVASATPAANRVPKALGTGKLTAGWLTAAVLLTDLGLGAGVAGDLLYGSGANTLARLGIGSAGRLLVAGASAPEWSSKLAEGTITGLMTFSKTGSTAREMTFPDAAIVVAGSASALTSGRVPFVLTSGLLADSSEWTRAASSGGYYISHIPTADGTGTAYSSYDQLNSNPTGDNTGTIQGSYMEARSTAGNAANYSSTTWGITGFLGVAQHYGSGTAASVIGGGFGPVARPGCGVVAKLAGLKTLIQNLHTTQAVTLGIGVDIATPSNAGGNYVTYKAISIAATAVGTTNCIGIDIGAMTGTGAYAIRTSTGAVLFGDQVTAPNGTAAAPGLRLTTEASGLYRNSATSLGISIAGVAALALAGPGTGYGGGIQLKTAVDADYTYIYGDRTNAEMRFSAGSSSTDGGAIRLFGSTHANASTGRLYSHATLALTWSATGLTAAVAATVPNGTAAAPGIRLTSEAHGLYRYNASALGLAAAGVAVGRLYTPVASTYGGWLAFENPAGDQPGGISNSTTTSFLVAAGGSSFSVGGQLRAYGNAHATKANYVEFTRGATISAFFNDSGTLTLNSKLTFAGSTSGSASIKVAAIAGAPADLTLPTTSGSAGYVLSTDGSGVLSWVDAPTYSGGALVSTGKVTGPACTTSTASFNAPHGTAPTTPVNGDIWSTTDGLFARVNGATRGIRLFDTSYDGMLTAYGSYGHSTSSGVVSIDGYMATLGGNSYELRNGQTAGQLEVAGGSGFGDGGSIVLYGSTNGTASKTVRIYSEANIRIEANATGLGFFAATPIAKPTVTGSRGGNAALASLLSMLSQLGLLTDSSS